MRASDSMQKRQIKAVDFFCSGGGMTNGMRQAGIDVIAGIDFDPACKLTYDKNNPSSQFILADVFKLTEKELENRLSLKRNDNDLVLIGCSPCQFWSIIRTDKKKSEQSKDLLGEFHRFVKYFNPGYVVVENVPGIERRKDESGLNSFITDMERRGYKVKYKVVNLNDYGVPQTRRRFSLVATRVADYIFPKPVEGEKPKVKDFLGIKKGFPKIKAGHRDETDFNHTAAGLSEKNLLRLIGTEINGGDAMWWRKDKKLGRVKYQGDGFKDNYSRMSWDKPAPTITTKFFSISNGRFAHPEEHRAISMREGATLQTFPKKYVFYTSSVQATSRMIGNAVPPEYAKRIGRAIIKSQKV
jgi:DNA (cytosine-5)-methyltransferase 1